MTQILTQTERGELVARHRKERDKRVADRIKAVLLTDDGWSSEAIAKALFLDDSTVRRHLADFYDERRLEPAHRGSEPILNHEESVRLSRHLEDNLCVSVKEIREHIRAVLGKELSQSATYDWLKKNGFTYKKPKLVPKNADPEEQRKFIAEYEALMTRASLDGEPVLFGDSVHPSQQSRPAYGWIKKKSDRLLETISGRKRMNIMGTLELETMRLVYQDFETVDAAAAVEFLKTVEKAYPDAPAIHLVWDQAGYHTCREVKKYLETSRVRVHFLPPRSPNLNAIERLWKVMHKYVSNNRCYPKFKDFKASLINFFDKVMPEIFDELVSSVTDNFRVALGAK